MIQLFRGVNGYGRAAVLARVRLPKRRPQLARRPVRLSPDPCYVAFEKNSRLPPRYSSPDELQLKNTSEGRVVIRYTSQIVSRTQPGDQPRLLVDGALGRQHAYRDGDARAVVRQTRIVTLAAVVSGPELLATAPGLEV